MCMHLDFVVAVRQLVLISMTSIKVPHEVTGCIFSAKSIGQELFRFEGGNWYIKLAKYNLFPNQNC